MAADAVVEDAPVNSCCATWKDRYSKLQQRNTKLEDARTALRHGIEIFERQIAKIQTENLNLKKAYEEQKARADNEREEKVKESALRVSFEDEIRALKSEIFSLQQKCGSASESVDEVKLLWERISETEKEINRLKDLLEKERIRGDNEKKKAEAETKKANEALKKLKEEKRGAGEEREKKLKESAIRGSLENEVSALKSEIFSLQQKGGSGAGDVNEAVTLLRARISEAETEINRLKDLLEKERMRADSEKKKANEALKTVKAEKSRADEERKLAGIEGRKAEEDRIQLERLMAEVDEAKSKLVLETLKSKEANKKLEAERQKVIKEKKRADSEMSKAEEQRKLAELNRGKALEEKCCADHLSQQLGEDRRRIEKLQQEIAELVSSKKLVDVPTDQPAKQMNAETAKPIAGLWVEMLKGDSNESKLGLDCSKSEEANKRCKEGKQKANRERKRADSEMRKEEEHRKAAVVFKEKAMDERKRADQLAQQLEDSRRMIEGLQKKMQELVSARTLVEPPVVLPDKNVNAEMKLLRKQLKFDKMQVKHAKQVAKLEKGRNNLLQQELCRLKQEFVQFSHHLNILDNCFSHSNVGTDDLVKAGKPSNIQSLNLKRRFLGLEPYHMHLHNGNELRKPNCSGVDASDRFKQSIPCSAPMFPTSGGNFYESISGIDSKLEPLLRGSSRKLLKSSAMNSSMASFSDRSLVGSQERGDLSVTEPAQLTEEKSSPHPQISTLPGDITKKRHNENIAEVAENNVRSPLRPDTVEKRDGHSKKRKRILNAVESIEKLYREGKNWHLQLSENLSMLYNMFESQMYKPLEGGRCLVTSLQDNLYAKQDKSQEEEKKKKKKKKKAFSEEKVAPRNISYFNERKVGLVTKGVDEAIVHIPSFTPLNNVTGPAQACKDGICDSDGSNLRSFEELEDWDCMKLLEFDNPIDEEKYRMAMENPLSPSLPEIKFQSIDMYEIDDSEPTVVDCYHERFSNANEYMVPYCSFDVMNMEIESNKIKHNTFVTAHVPLLQKKGVTIDSFEITMNEENRKFNTVHGSDTRVSPICDSSAQLGTFNSGDGRPKISGGSELGSTLGGLPQYCVMFSDTNDSSSVSKVFSATRTCMAQCSMISQTDMMVRKALIALLKVEGLLPKEKVCVFFSLLLHNFSEMAVENFRNLSDKDSTFFLDSFAEHMHRVMSDAETSIMFAELCILDELLALIEDFLIDRKVLVHNDVPSSVPLLGIIPRVSITLNGEDIILSVQKASTRQLVAGAIVLASLCATVDHIGFICEASCNIFKMQKMDTPMLTILHVFAYICGSKYFTLSEYSLMMTVIKSLITFIERENLSANTAITLPSSTEVRPEFPSCTGCPFSEGAVFMDVVVSLLLEKLQNCCMSDIQHKDMTQPVKLLNSEALSHNEEKELSSGHVSLCQLGDVLSLVELVACNMSWDWTRDKIVSQLLKMLDSCVLENLLAAIVVLLGQLGRLGVDAKGYEDDGVENLRGRLSSFLWQSILRKMDPPIQIATVTALLGVISPSFEEVININTKLPAAATHLRPVADCIRQWFSLLGKEQQSLSFRILTAVVPPSSKT